MDRRIIHIDLSSMLSRDTDRLQSSLERQPIYTITLGLFTVYIATLTETNSTFS